MTIHHVVLLNHNPNSTLELRRGTLPATNFIQVTVLDLTHKGLYQPKASAWVTQSHHYYPALPITYDVVSTTKFLHVRGGVSSSPAHWSETNPHQERRVAASKATMPLLEGHKDLKRSTSLRYKGNTTQSLKALCSQGLTSQGCTIYSVYPSLGYDLKWLERLDEV
jgi:hypothetical protein